ncbi:hypothetical protein [Citrobacter phage Ci1]|nr:hypothetical protein [Citrobacter phage Ci1]
MSNYMEVDPERKHFKQLFHLFLKLEWNQDAKKEHPKMFL